MFNKIRILPIFLLLLFISACSSSFFMTAGNKNFTVNKKIQYKNMELSDFQYDFVYLVELLEEGFPLIESVVSNSDRIKLQDEIMQILQEPNIKKEFFELQIDKYLGLFQNGHTHRINQSRSAQKYYPFNIHISKNRWRLIDIKNDIDSLYIGKEIIAINGFSVDEVEKKLSSFSDGENKIGQQYDIRSYLVQNPTFYLATNIIDTVDDSLEIKFATEEVIKIYPLDSKEIKLYNTKFPNNEITQFSQKPYSYEVFPQHNFTYMQFNVCSDKNELDNYINQYVKFWLKPFAKLYLHHQLNKKELDYNIAQNYHPDYPIFRNFVEKVISSTNDKNITNLIIDLRNNPGGNPLLGKELLYYLTQKEDLLDFTRSSYTSDILEKWDNEIYQQIKKENNGIFLKHKLVESAEKSFFYEIEDEKSKYYIPKNRETYKGNIYILANYKIGSAASMLTTLFKDNDLATIIGTSVATNPTGAITMTTFKLPKTDIFLNMATTYSERPNRKENKIFMPDYWVEYSVEDLFSGRDPFLDKAIKLIKINTE